MFAPNWISRPIAIMYPSSTLFQRLLVLLFATGLTVLTTACAGDLAENRPPGGDNERVLYDTTGVIDHVDSEDVETTYIVGNSRRVFLSEDRVNWSTARILDREFHANSVAQSDDLIVTVGPVGQVYAGSQWNLLDEQATINTGGVDPWLERVIYNAAIDEFWAIGDGDVLITSADGQSWNVETGPAGNTDLSLRGIAHDNNDPARWVIVGQSGLISYSTDGGNSWTATDLATASGQAINYTLHGVTFADPASDGGFFVTTGKDGRAYKARADQIGNAGAWTELDIDVNLSLDGVNLWDVAFINGQLFIVGDDELILRSVTGNNWVVENESLTLSGGLRLVRVLPTFDTVVAVGQDRVIRTRSTQVIDDVEEVLWLESNR